MDLTTPGLSYKWNHIIFVFLWLAYFIPHDVFKVHTMLDHVSEFPSFQGWIIIHCMLIYATFYYLFVSRHLGCFTIVNNGKQCNFKKNASLWLSQKDKYVWFHLHEVARAVKCVERVGERGKWVLFNVYRVSVLKDEKILEIGCTTMKIYLTLLTCTLKRG